MPVPIPGSTSGSSCQTPSVFQAAAAPRTKPSAPLVASMVAYLQAGAGNPLVNPLMNDNVRNVMSAFRLSDHCDDIYVTGPQSDGSRYEMEFRGDQAFFRIYTKDERLYSQTPLPERAEMTRFMEHLIANAETLAEWKAWAKVSAPGEKRAEALKRVTDNIYSNGTYLDLSHLNLTSIPPHIPCRVTELRLNCNELTKLPELHHGLVSLQLIRNALTVLPTEYPPTLTELVVTANNLTSLPDFPNTLTSLDLSANKLTCFKGIPLTVTKLVIQHNHASHTTLPDFTAFTSLEILYLPAMELKACPPLPPGIVELALDGNPFDRPPEVAQLKQLRILTINNCHLTSLPKLPQNLLFLSANDNKISSLPPLPGTLKKLSMWKNRLSATGELPGALEEVNFSYNQLDLFYASLPQLHTLSLASNKLTCILGSFSNTLTKLDVENNQLTALPPLPDSLTYLDFSDNLFISPPPQLQVIKRYIDDDNLYDYRQPIMSIVQWFDSNKQPEEIQRWSKIAAGTCPVVIEKDIPTAERVARIRQNETRKSEKARLFLFGRFIDRLHDLLKKDPGEGEYVRKWLGRISVDPELRRSAFYLAEEASETCGDRVLLYWSQMKLAVMVTDAENLIKKMDVILIPAFTRPQSDILPSLVKAGKDIFFTEKLNEVSNQLIMKARAARSTPAIEDGNLRSGPEEVEIMLAVHCKLSPLLLSTTQPSVNMFHFACSGLNEEKLIDLFDEIKETEKTEFIPWFAQWHVWQSFARRQYGDLIKAGEDRLDLAMYPEERDEEGNLTGSGEFERLTSEILAGMGFGTGVPPPEDVSTQAGRKASHMLKSQIWGDVFYKIAERNSNLAQALSLVESTGSIHRQNLSSRRRSSVSPGMGKSDGKRASPPSSPPPVAVASSSKEPSVRNVESSTGLSPSTGHEYHPLM